MNRQDLVVRWLPVVSSFAVLVGLVGCESTPKTYPGPEGVTYREVDRIKRVWVADGFDFTGYDVVWVNEVEVEGQPDDDKEAEWLLMAKYSTRNGMVAACEATKLFSSVVRNEAEIKPGSRVLKLETSLTEFDRGSTGMRIAFGYYAGRSHIRIRGRMSELNDGKPLFLFEITRVYHCWAVGRFMNKVARHEPIKYHD